MHPRGHIPLGAWVHPSVTNGHRLWSFHKGYLWRLPHHMQQIDLMCFLSGQIPSNDLPLFMSFFMPNIYCAYDSNWLKIFSKFYHSVPLYPPPTSFKCKYNKLRWQNTPLYQTMEMEAKKWINHFQIFLVRDQFLKKIPMIICESKSR